MLNEVIFISGQRDDVSTIEIENITEWFELDHKNGVGYVPGT